MKGYMEKETLVIELEGRISSDNVEKIEDEIRDILSKNQYAKLCLDAEKLEYISSAGLRLLLKLSKENKEPVVVRNVSSEVYDIFDTTGFNTFLDVKKKLRTMSVDGCPIVGKGGMGTVYRIDNDTIIKVYDVVNDIEVIENEVEKAKKAFLSGIPTAIPFDIVRVGNKYGAVFEMIKAKSCNDYLIENIDKTDEIIKKYADFIKSVHSVHIDNAKLPDVKETYFSYLEGIRDTLGDELYNKILKVLQQIPDENGIIHGDIQMKNIMISTDEMILIDMDTISIGSPLFEFAGLYVGYVPFGIHDEKNNMEFYGLDNDTVHKLFYDTLKYYYEDEDEESFKEKLDTIKILGTIRFLYLIIVLGIGVSELRDIRIKDSLDLLRDLAG